MAPAGYATPGWYTKVSAATLEATAPGEEKPASTSARVKAEREETMASDLPLNSMQE